MQRRRPIPRTVAAVLMLAWVSACGSSSGSGSTAGPTSAAPSTSAIASSASATSTPVTAPTPAAAPATTISSDTTASVTAGEGFAACPAPVPGASGEPPPGDNGSKGACEAAQILLPLSGTPCAPSTGRFGASRNCPVTDALAQVLDANPLGGPGGGANAVCRCQAGWQSAAYGVATATDPTTPTSGTVRVILSFGPASTESLDVVVVGVASGSLVDDIQCAGGGAPTSIRSPGGPQGPCA